MDTATLEHIGLTKNESKVYLALLKIGSSKTGKILKESKLNSGKIYEILDALKNKGLISETIINSIKHYTAAPPEQLLEYVNSKKKLVDEQEREIRTLIPQLSTIKNLDSSKKSIVTYTGFRGISTAAEEALAQLSSREEIISLGISDRNAWSQSYWMKWEKMRIQKKITARYILSQKGKIYDDLKSVSNVDLRILPADTPVGIDIYGGRIVLILHYQEPVSCTLIYDEHTAKTFCAYFELLWKLAKK